MFKLDIKKNKSKHLIFSDNDVTLINKIKEYRLQGLSIDDIRDKLNSYQSPIKVPTDSYQSSIDVLALNEVTNIENRITEVFNTKFQSLIELSNTIATTSQQLGMLQAENTFIKELSKLDKNKIVELEENIKDLSNKHALKDKDIDRLTKENLDLYNEIQKLKTKKWYHWF